MPESHSILHVSLHKVTPLHGAAEKGHFEEIVGYLVKKGTNINVEDNNGVSLHYWGRSELLEFKLTSSP